MGRFAQVLSIGVKGAVEIELPKREYFAGEFVVGHVKLSVKDPIDAEAFVLTLSGKEHLSWRVRQGKTTNHHHVKHEIVRQQIPLVGQPTTFVPGEFVFPFQFQLPLGLPGTFSMHKSNVQHLSRVMSSILYSVAAEVKVKGMLSANLGCKEKIGIHAVPRLPQQPPLPLEDTISRPVYFMCCVNKGTCHITGTTSTSYVDWMYGAVRIQGSVRNESTSEIAAVYVRLYQDFTIHVPNGFTHGGSRYVTERLLHQTKLDRIAPGETKESVIADISIANVVASMTGEAKGFYDDDMDLRQLQPFAQPPLHPTTDMMFVSISYHLEIYCPYSWSTGVKLEFPLGVHQLPLAPVPIDPTLPV